MKPSSKGVQDVVTGFYADENELVRAIRYFKAKEVTILDVHTPFPVHGLDDELELPKQEGLATVGLLVGILGLAIGFLMQITVSVKFYPINFGGKPFLSIPSFMPIVIMLMFLLSAFSIAFAFMFKSGMGAGATSLAIDPNTSNDRFLIVLEGGDKAGEALSHLQQTGALDIKTDRVQTTR